MVINFIIAGQDVVEVKCSKLPCIVEVNQTIEQIFTKININNKIGIIVVIIL